MSVRCPDCGAVAGYGGEIGHASDCPMVVGVSAATQMQIARLSGVTDHTTAISGYRAYERRIKEGVQ